MNFDRWSIVSLSARLDVRALRTFQRELPHTFHYNYLIFRQLQNCELVLGEYYCHVSLYHVKIHPSCNLEHAPCVRVCGLASRMA